MDLARIENPLEPPDRWRIRLSTLSEDPETLPGSAFVVAGDHLHAFAFLDPTGAGQLDNLRGHVLVLSYFALF